MDYASRPGRILTLAGYYSFVLIGWNAVLIPALIRSIEHDFRQSDAEFGLLYLLSALLYSSGSLSGGFVTERLGRRIVLPSAALLLGLGLGGEAIAPSWVTLLLAALALNIGAGAIDGGVNGLFLDLYQEARGGALNLLHLFFSVGALVCPFVVGHLVGAGVSWRAVLLATGVASIALSVILVAQRIPSGRPPQVAETAREAPTRAERSLLPFAGLAISIGLYVAAEAAVSGWLVKFLVSSPVATATTVLSIFWGGLAVGRLLSRWIAERFDYVVFTVSCIVLASGALIAAVLVPLLPLSAALFGVAGLCYGPVFPMIVAIGGNIYPHRLSALSGSLAAAAVFGAVVYPPLVGFMAAHVGLRAGLLGAGLLGVPGALAVIVARSASHRSDPLQPGSTVEAAS